MLPVVTSLSALWNPALAFWFETLKFTSPALQVPNSRACPPLVSNLGLNRACRVRRFVVRSCVVTPLVRVLVKSCLKRVGHLGFDVDILANVEGGASPRPRR